MLERGEPVVQVERARLRPALLRDGEEERALAAIGQRGAPFPVTAVERQHRIARLEPQRIAQVVGLRAVEREPGAGRQRMVDEEPRGTKIVSWHGAVRQG